MNRLRQHQLVVFAFAAAVAGIAGLRLDAQTQAPDQFFTMPGQPQTMTPSRRDGLTDVLALSATGGAGVEDNGQPVQGELRDPQFQGRQTYSDVSGAVVYNTVNASRFGLQLNATGGARYYDTLHEVLSNGESVGAATAFPLGRRTTVALTSGFSYSPNYALAQFTDLVPNTDAVVTANDLALVRRPAYTSGLTAALTESFGPKASFMMNYGLHRSDFVNNEDPSLVAQSGYAMFRYRFSRNVGFHAGYGRRVGEYNLLNDTQSAPIEDIDIGLDYNYNRGVSLSKKTTLSFGSGSSITEQDHRHHFTVTGTVNLDQAFTRYSHATLTYTRGVQLLEGFVEPVYSDSLTAAINGAIGARVHLATSASYSMGEVGLSGNNNDYRAWNTGGRMTVDLSRLSMLYVSYGFSSSDIGSGVQLVHDVPYTQRRHSLRVGASLRVPVIRRRVTAERK